MPKKNYFYGQPGQQAPYPPLGRAWGSELPLFWPFGHFRRALREGASRPDNTRVNVRGFQRTRYDFTAHML